MLRSLILRPRYTADSGGGSGSAGSGQQPPPNGDASGQQPPAGQPQNGGTQQDRTFSQADVDRIVAERLARAQQKAQADADKARQEAEQRALAEQGEYKTLAEQRAAKLAELEPKAGQVERYERALKAQVDHLRKDLPDHITALLDKMDPAEQLEYLAANRDKLVATPPPANPAPNINGGGGHTPAGGDPKEREAELRQRFRLGRR